MPLSRITRQCMSDLVCRGAQGHDECKRERNQHQFFHTGTSFGKNYSRRNALDVRFLRSAPATGDTEDLVFGMKQVCSLGTPWVKHRAKTRPIRKARQSPVGPV